MIIACCIILLYLNNGVITEDMKDLSFAELLKLGQDVSQIQPYEFQPSDVQFYLLTKSSPESVLVTSKNINIVDSNKKTKIIIHGWLENHRRSWYKTVGDKYLKNEDLNFIEVNWEHPARVPYFYSARSTRDVGYQIAQMIEDTNLPPKTVHIIGHSLGSHVAGFAGKKYFNDTGEKLKRITALDPAGPYFRLPNINTNDRLDKEDADIVDALHTDAGFFGYENPIGTVDIYINGGQRFQPGCLDEWNNAMSIGDVLGKSFCSHARSVKYFIEWIDNGKFQCRFCQSILGINLSPDRCILHYKELVLGSEDITEDVTGVCFAETNEIKPFLS